MAKGNEPAPPGSLESILCTEELNKRPSRAPDYKTENRALVALVRALADSPRTILQTLTDTILEVLRAGSAGISLLTEDGKRFYWPAVSGVWKPHIGGGTPRDFGPCGDVLDRNIPLMFKHIERRYTYFQPVTPKVEEALLVPFYAKGKAVGTIWAVAHDDRRKFDNEDLRQLTSLGAFASSAYQARLALDALDKYEETRAGLASIVDSSDDPIISKTLDGVIKSWNRAAERTFGFTAAEAIGQHITLIVPAERRAEEEDILARLRRDQKVEHFETERQTKDGRRASISLTVSPIRNSAGDIIGASEVARDISDRKRREAALLGSEIRYRRLFEAAHDGILIVDAKTAKIVDVNRFLLDLLRFPREHFIGKELWELGVFRDKVENREAMRTLQHERSIRYENLPLQDRDGRRVPVEFVSNIYQEDHHPIIQCNIRDIGERVRFETERSTLLANEQASRMEAEAANSAKDIFLATLSHELRTPLTAILGWAVLLRAAPADEKVVKEAALTIERNAKMQAQLIEDVLDVSRIVSGKLRLNMRPCDLSRIIQDAVASVQPAADAKDIHVAVQVINGASSAVCDAARIQQVIWNLLTNAIKFSPKMGDIRVLVERVNSMVRVTITDGGEGISPEFLPHVFERFRQSDGTSTRKHGGLGLGLSIVRHLIELHGGTVEVQSEGLGRGATFIINLPIRAVTDAPAGGDGDGAPHEMAVPAAGAAGAPAMVRLDGLRVLVVDDEPDARTVIAATLQRAGATVAAAGSATEALKLLSDVPPHVIVSDISMPDQDGYELMKQIRSMGTGFGGRELPAIALTAYARTEDRRRALLAGFQMHVAKPVDPIELAEVVASLAGRTGLS